MYLGFAYLPHRVSPCDYCTTASIARQSFLRCCTHYTMSIFKLPHSRTLAERNSPISPYLSIPTIFVPGLSSGTNKSNGFRSPPSPTSTHSQTFNRGELCLVYMSPRYAWSLPDQAACHHHNHATTNMSPQPCQHCLNPNIVTHSRSFHSRRCFSNAAPLHPHALMCNDLPLVSAITHPA